ncbi:polyprenyl synthetase family protein [Streptomyces sp. NPDC004237]|uniref:polyprenyl synthetase family protein n=1 Tax=Streptomyces sp. NPDC004237 TaxID=3154455 RepID=UPI0033BB58F6
MTHPSATGTPDLAAARLDVDSVLRDFLDRKEESAPGPEMTPLFTTLRHLLTRGKRLRAQLCVTGWHAAGGNRETAGIATAASAALELFQASALIHDDVMDASDTRRGRPSAHRALSAAYTACGGRSSRSDTHGLNAAVLLGDLALMWSDELLRDQVEPAALARALPVMAVMRSELVYGQYLDLLSTDHQLSGDVEAALRVVRYKTAKYTVERPLHIGAALAGGGTEVLDACSAFAIPLGEAFQLRDDLLGVFGDPAQTGKPVGDDLREGKSTVLLALAVQQADEDERHVLRTLVGRPDLAEEDILHVRAILEATGARERVEEMIAARRSAAVTALDQAPIPADTVGALHEIARIATARHA